MKRILFCIAMIYGSAYGATLHDERLRIAARDGNVAEVQRLLDTRAEVDSASIVDAVSLYYAAKAGHTAIVVMLLSAGADPYAVVNYNESPLDAVARSDNQELVDTFFKLVSPVPSDNASVKNSWFNAAFHGHLPVLNRLLFAGKINPNITWAYERTALDYAILGRDTSAVRFLLAQKCVNPNLKNEVGNTPLHEAVDSNNQDIIRMLLDARVDAGIPNNDGDTALVFAKKKNNLSAYRAIWGYVLRKTPLDLATKIQVRSLLQKPSARPASSAAAVDTKL